MAKKWYKRVPSMHEVSADHAANCWNAWCKERWRLRMIQASATPPAVGIRTLRKRRDSPEMERCWYCGEFMDTDARSLRRKSIDHLHPRSRGGGNNESNLVLACQWCNGDKGAQTLAEYRASSAKRIGVPTESITFYGERHPL